MKFLCVECDRQMTFEERQLPGDGTLAAAFRCPKCGRGRASPPNRGEPRWGPSLGVKSGGPPAPAEPLEGIRSNVATGRDDAFTDDRQPTTDNSLRWSPDASDRLSRVPGFVRGMVKKIYADYAKQRGIGEITPAVMDAARTELGLEGM